MHLERFKIKSFLPRERGHSFPRTPSPQLLPFGPCHIPCTPLTLLILTFYSELCMVLITTKELKSGLKMWLERFKNLKISYPGNGDTPSLGSLSPPQPWPFGPWHIPSTLLISFYSNLYLNFYKKLCMVWITTEVLKSCLKMLLARVKIKNFLHRERGHPFPWTTSPAALGLATYQVSFCCCLF